MKNNKVKEDYKQIKLTVTISDYEKISEICEQQKITMSKYIRENLNLNEIHTSKSKKNKTNNVVELGKIGNLLNQIARHCNINNEFEVDILKKLGVIEKLLMEVLMGGNNNAN